MTKTLEELRIEENQQRQAERKRLLAIDEIDAMKLPVPDRYQRIRYLKEIEGMEMIERYKREAAAQPIVDQKPKQRRKHKDHWLD